MSTLNKGSKRVLKKWMHNPGINDALAYQAT